MEIQNNGITSNKYRILISGALLQMCAGILYMWSVFNKPVSQYLYGDDISASMTASIMLASFVAGILIGGKLVDRFGSRLICLAGSIMMSLGIFTSAFVTPEVPELIMITYGLIGGLGVGLIYNSTVAAIQRNFTENRGFATGVLVSAFGFSLVIFSPIVKYLIGTVGLQSTFMILGVSLAIICIISSLSMATPKGYIAPGLVETEKDRTPKQMLRMPEFYLITLSLFLVLPAYFILNPQFVSLGEARGLTEEMALLGVMLTGIFSACGRLFISWMTDRIGNFKALCLIGLLTIVGVLALIFAEGYLFLVMISIIAFAFGGAAGVYAVTTAGHFGTKYMGTNYGIVMLGFGASAILFPLISKNITADGDMTLAFVLFAITAILSLVCILLLRYRESKKMSA